MTIHFIDEGKRRRYTPDFEVRWSNGRVDIVEVKYRADLRAQWSRLRPAFAAMRPNLPSKAQFRIATERGIRGPTLEAAKRLVPLRGVPIDPTLAVRARAAAGTAGTTFAALTAALGGSKSAALSTIWRLLAAGELHADFTAPITQGSRIFRR